MKKTLLSILGVATLALGSAQSAVVFDTVLGNLGPNGNDPLDEINTQVLGPARWFAVGFNLASNPGQWYGLETVKIGLIGSASVTLTLYSDSVLGNPGSALAQFDTEVVNSGSPVLTTFSLNQGSSVTPSGNSTNISPGNYWFVASSSSFVNWVNSASGTTPQEFTPVNPNVGPPSASGWTYVGTKFTTNSGTNWTAILPGAPAQNLSISVAAIPEPGTWAAMAILAGGAAFAGWRRRRQQTA